MEAMCKLYPSGKLKVKPTPVRATNGKSPAASGTSPGQMLSLYRADNASSGTYGRSRGDWLQSAGNGWCHTRYMQTVASRSATDLTTVYHFEVSRRAASVFRFPADLSACDLSTELLNGAGFNSHLSGHLTGRSSRCCRRPGMVTGHSPCSENELYAGRTSLSTPQRPTRTRAQRTREHTRPCGRQAQLLPATRRGAALIRMASKFEL